MKAVRFPNPWRRRGAPVLPPGGVAPGSAAGPAPAVRRSLSELAADVFSLVLTLRTATDFGNVMEVRQRIQKLLERFQSEARKADHAAAAVDDAHFALVALLDEAVLNSGWKAGQGAWRIQPLQQELFKINTAGDEFFKRLERLRGAVAEHAEPLEVYFDCLALGFQGRFRLFGREKLDGLIGDVARDLARGRAWNVAELSPHWRRPDDFTEIVGEGVPMWMTALFFIPGALVLILLFALLAGSTAGRTARGLQELLSRLGS